MNKIKTLLAACLLLSTMGANAALIPLNGYLMNTDTHVVTGGGLDWLRWDQTLGRSVEWALEGNAESIAGGGWDLATNVDMSRLFNSFAFNYVFDADENTWQTQEVPLTTLEALDIDPFESFISLFGETHTLGTNWRGGDIAHESSALFGRDLDRDGLYNQATVISVRYYLRDVGPLPAVSHITNDHIHSDWTYSDSGTKGLALVRLSAVPEPSIVTLFSLGVLGLGIARRRQYRS